MKQQEAFVGMELPSLQVGPITRKTLALFAGASGDHQPTHIDIDAARAKGRQDVIAHGMLMMAYLGRVLTDWVPQHRIRSYKARFVAMTPVHAVANCSGRVTAIDGGLATVELSIQLVDGPVVVRADAVVDIRESRESPLPGGEPPPLVIRQQGSFAAGGKVLRHPGTYDPTRPGPEGRTPADERDPEPGHRNHRDPRPVR